MTTYAKTWLALLSVCLLIAITGIAQASPPRNSGSPRGGLVSCGPSGISSGGGTFTGPVCLEDDVELQFGSACGDQAIYSNDTDLYMLLQDAGSDGAMMIALEDSPPAPDEESVHIWKGSAGATNCSARDILCLENSATTYIRTLVPATGFGGIIYGDTAAPTSGGFLYGLSSNASDPNQFRFFADGNTRFLDMGVGVMEWKQGTVLSSLSGNLSLQPAGNLGLEPAGNVVIGDNAFFEFGVSAGITASATQSQGQQPLTSTINQVSVVATSSDVVTLPPAAAGRTVEIYNKGANLLQIYPASGDDLGIGVDVSAHIPPGGVADFSAYDSTTWIEKQSTPILLGAEMFDFRNTDVYTINAQDEVHCYHTNGMTVDASSLSGGWTQDDGGAGVSHVIDSVADAGSGDITVTTGTSHLLEVDDIITQTALTDAAYVGIFKVLTVPTGTTYTVTAVYTATDTGVMDQCAYMQAPATGGSGRYIASADLTATNGTNNESFDFRGYADTVAYDKAEVRRKFATVGDYGSVSGGGFAFIGDSTKIVMTITNVSGTGTITVRNFNFRTHRM